MRESGSFRDIAFFVGGALSASGFRLFENGGLPLLERWCGPYRQEILMVPTARMTRSREIPFSVRVHLSNRDVARVRGRYWRPPLRAPDLVACGDLGEIAEPDRKLTWCAEGGLETANALVSEIQTCALPWFQFFAPGKLKDRLYAAPLPLIDDCTALELLLAEFDPYEARRYVRVKMRRRLTVTGPIVEPSGFELSEDRLAPIASYYRL